MPDGPVILAERYLQRRSKPRLLVLCISAVALNCPKLAANTDPARDWFFWCYGPQTEASVPSHEFPLLGYYVREGICFAVGRLGDQLGQPPFERRWVWTRGDNYASYRERWLRMRGGHREIHRELHDRPARPSTGDPFPVADPARQALWNLARLTRQHSVPMMIRLTPVIEGGPNTSEQVNTLFAELKREFPHVIVSSPEFLSYPPDHFRDTMHCNVKGAALFTHFLADAVTGVLDKK